MERFAFRFFLIAFIFSLFLPLTRAQEKDLSDIAYKIRQQCGLTCKDYRRLANLANIIIKGKAAEIKRVIQQDLLNDTFEASVERQFLTKLNETITIKDPKEKQELIKKILAKTNIRDLIKSFLTENTNKVLTLIDQLAKCLEYKMDGVCANKPETTKLQAADFLPLGMFATTLEGFGGSLENLLSQKTKNAQAVAEATVMDVLKDYAIGKLDSAVTSINSNLASIFDKANEANRESYGTLLNWVNPPAPVGSGATSLPDDLRDLANQSFYLGIDGANLSKDIANFKEKVKDLSFSCADGKNDLKDFKNKTLQKIIDLRNRMRAVKNILKAIEGRNYNGQYGFIIYWRERQGGDIQKKVSSGIAEMNKGIAQADQYIRDFQNTYTDQEIDSICEKIDEVQKFRNNKQSFLITDEELAAIFPADCKKLLTINAAVNQNTGMSEEEKKRMEEERKRQEAEELIHRVEELERMLEEQKKLEKLEKDVGATPAPYRRSPG